MLFKKKKQEQANEGELPQSYWSYVKRQFRKNKRALYSMYLIIFLAFIALFADFIANDKPLMCKYEGSTYFPVFREYGVKTGLMNWQEEFLMAEWYELEYDWAVWPPIPYKNTTIDYMNAPFVGPFDKQDIKSARWRHLLGTNKLGNDVMACMIHGTRIAFLVGIVSMGIAFVIGVLLGAMAGFFGDDQLKMSRGRILMNLIAIPLSIFYFGVFFGKSLILALLAFLAVFAIANLLGKLFDFIPFFKDKVNVPMDIIITRFIEVVVSVPVLILVLSVVAVFPPSIFLVMGVIGLVRWTGIARFIRAELLRVRSLEYVEAAYALGYPRWRILLKHAIPNALAPVFIAVAFGIAAAILIESFLSFLGFGIPIELNTWGQLLTQSRQAPEAWWLAIFPGFAIFITVTLFNLIGEGLTDAIDPRLKQ